VLHVRTNRSATPFGLWHAKPRANDFNAVGAEDVVKTRGEFLIPIANAVCLDEFAPRHFPPLPHRSKTRGAQPRAHGGR
jgi:hypothetical protein